MKRLGAKLKKYFFVGLAVILPVFITVYTLVLIFRFTDRLVGRSINLFLQDRFGFSIYGLGFFLVIFCVLAVGFVYSHFTGRKFFLILERVFKKIPLVSKIYPSAKELSNFLFRQDAKNAFKKVVLVEYPGPGSYSMGFITNENLEALSTAESGKLLSVFVPMPPTPLSGFMILVPRQKIRVLDIPMEQAMKFIISGGIIFSSDTKTEKHGEK